MRQMSASVSSLRCRTRLCFLKRYRRRLMDDLHVAQEKLACIDYMIYELEQKRLDR